MTAAAPSPRSAPAPAPSAWAPFRNRAFAVLWVAQLGSNIGSWMQSVGAQWFLVRQTDSPALVAWVSAASLLPVLLLALVAGVLADLVDRRRLLIVTNALATAITLVLFLLTVSQLLTPALLLAFTFALGVSAALAGPAWQAIQPELVPRAEIPAAASLSSVTVNGARAVGPAVAGVLISLTGIGSVFLVNTLSFVGVAIALFVWRRTPTARTAGREPFGEALVAGLRYVRHAPGIRRILLRAALFCFPASALWSLLPSAASRVFHLSSSGYGLMLGALGVGAVIGVIVMPRLRRLSTSWVLFAAALTFAIGTLVTATGPLALALVVYLPTGVAWIAVLTTLNATLQLTAAAWVRARAVSVYLIVFLGGQGVAALVWGVVAQAVDVVPALVIGAIATALAGALALLVPLRTTDRPLDRTVVALSSGAPQLVFEPEPSDPVTVAVRYRVDHDHERAFVRAMTSIGESRQRTGAYRWSLTRSGDAAGEYLETFSERSWSEFRRSEGERWTVYDAQPLAVVKPCVTSTTHYFPVHLTQHA